MGRQFPHDGAGSWSELNSRCCQTTLGRGDVGEDGAKSFGGHSVCDEGRRRVVRCRIEGECITKMCREGGKEDEDRGGLERVEANLGYSWTSARSSLSLHSCMCRCLLPRTIRPIHAY